MHICPNAHKVHDPAEETIGDVSRCWVQKEYFSKFDAARDINGFGKCHEGYRRKRRKSHVSLGPNGPAYSIDRSAPVHRVPSCYHNHIYIQSLRVSV